MNRAATTVRAATPDDAASIASIHVRTWQVAYRGQIPDEVLDALRLEQRERWWRVEWWKQAGARHRLLVAESGDGIVGFVAVGPSRDDVEVEATGDGVEATGEVYAIYVDPDLWRLGVGSNLMERAVEELRSDGFRQATLWVIETNARARRFYSSAGWSTDGARKTERIGPAEITEIRYRRGSGGRGRGAPIRSSADHRHSGDIAVSRRSSRRPPVRPPGNR